MPRIHLETIRQGQDLPLNAAIEIARALVNMLGEIRATDGADEQSIAGQQKPWLSATRRIRDHKTDAFRRVTGGMKNPDRRVTENDFLTIS